jgi:ABC-type transport system substrate-binding protein
MNARSLRSGLSRRDLLRGTTAGAAALAGTSLLPGVPRGFGGRALAQEEEPQRGGVYRLTGQGDIRGLDPGSAEGSEDWWSAGMLLYNQLYAYDADAQFYADLAADFPAVSADGLVYTIPIRQGVKFHNGRELVAADVAHSLAWQLWPEVYSWGKSYMENVVGYDEVLAGTTKDLSGIKIVDPYTIEITLKRPQAVFPSILSMTMNGISPKEETIAAGADWGSKVVIGTGPFKLVEWKQGQQVVYERHAEYYKTGLPYLDRVELNLNVDPSVQMLRWENGEVEHVHSIPSGELANVLTDDKYKDVRRTGGSIGTMRLNLFMGGPPFDNLQVRQAVATAIDKQFISQGQAGLITVMEGIYAPLMTQFDANFKSAYQYDPERAKQLLTEAGHADGLGGVRMWGPTGSEQIMEGIQADLQTAGIDAELVIGAFADYQERILAGEFHLSYFSWGASFPDAYDFVAAWMTCASMEDGVYNLGSYCNPRIDELVGQAEGLPQLDPQRIAAYREIEDLAVNQDVAMVGLGNPGRAALGREYVRNDPINGIIGGWPFLEAAWLVKE